MSTFALDSVFGPGLIHVGFQRGAASDGRAIYLAEVVSEDERDKMVDDASRDVLVTITDTAFELVTFIAVTDSLSYWQLLGVRDAHDDYAQVEFEGSWVLRRRIPAHPGDSVPRLTGLVAARTLELARYADRIAARLAMSLDSELLLAR